MKSIKLVFECSTQRGEVIAPMIAGTMAEAIEKLAFILPDPMRQEAQELCNLFRNAQVRAVEPERASDIIIDVIVSQ